MSAGAPARAAAQQRETVAIGVHAVLGLGGQLRGCVDWNVVGVSGFPCETTSPEWAEGSLGPSPGAGLRVLYVGVPHLALGLDVALTSLATARSPSVLASDVGALVGARLPVAVGQGGRIITPYVASTIGLSVLQPTLPRVDRFGDRGFHVSGLLGAEVELRRGFGLYVEVGLLYRWIRRDTPEPYSYSNGADVGMIQAALHVGVRVGT